MRDWWNDDQALAYVIVEQGRSACQRLLVADVDPRSEQRLWAAHDGFGLAAYAASDHLLAGVRDALYVMVQEAAGSPELPRVAPAPSAEHALMLAIHGATAIERCFATPWLVTQMQHAHRAVRQAHVALTGLVGLGVAAQRTLEATRLGYLERTWQAGHLRPPALDTQFAAPAAA